MCPYLSLSLQFSHDSHTHTRAGTLLLSLLSCLCNLHLFSPALPLSLLVRLPSCAPSPTFLNHLTHVYSCNQCLCRKKQPFPGFISLSPPYSREQQTVLMMFTKKQVKTNCTSFSFEPLTFHWLCLSLIWEIFFCSDSIWSIIQSFKDIFCVFHRPHTPLCQQKIWFSLLLFV